LSLAVAIVNTETGEVSVALAGAESPLLLHAATGEIEEVSGATGPLIGIEYDSEFLATTLQLAVGDLFLLTTDGITEARTPRQLGKRREFFGADGVARVLREEAPRAAALNVLAESVVEQARAWAGGAFGDDVCLLLARYLGEVTP